MRGFLANILTALQIGLRNTRREKRRSGIIISCAAVGAFSLIFMFGFMNGIFDSMMTASIQSGLGYVQIRPQGYNNQRKSAMMIQNPKEIEARFSIGPIYKKSVSFSPRFEQEGLLRLSSRIQGVLILGVEPFWEAKISAFAKWQINGVFIREQEKGAFRLPLCYLGKANADKFEVKVGDSIIISIADINGDSVSARFQVGGIYQSPVEPVDKSIVLVQRSVLSQMYAKHEQAVSSFTFSGIELEESEFLKQKIQERVGALPVEVLSYRELEPGLNRMLELSDLSFLIFSLILMGGFGLILFDSLLISVMERSFEIGLLRAIGTNGSLVFMMVLFEAVFLTLLGTCIGVLLAAFLAEIIFKNGVSLAAFSKGLELMSKTGSTIYPKLVFKNYWMTFLTALIVAFGAGIFPAWKAIKTIPAQALSQRK